MNLRGDVGGYDAEVLWDSCTVASMRAPLLDVASRPSARCPVASRSAWYWRALEAALAAFEGTVLSVTHDRWFMRRFDRFLVFRRDGSVIESLDPVWE